MSPTAHFKHEKDLDTSSNSSCKSDRFGNINTISTFTKGRITSKMIKLSNFNDTFMISCLNSDPFVFVSNNQISIPIYEKNDLIPFKPLQRLNSFAESNQALISSHGVHGLEFGKVTKNYEEDEIVISRHCQKTIENPFKKLLFANGNNLFYGKSDTRIEYYDFKRISRIGGLGSNGNILDFDLSSFNPNVSAYLDGNLNVMDIRLNNGGSLYKQLNSACITRWNPIMPYWIATSSSTSLNFYDIRYNSRKPLSTIQHGNIHELIWSSGNCDLILAASRDRRTNIWSMNHHSQDDCRLGMTMTRFDLRSIVTGNDEVNSFYGLDDSDALIRIEISSEYLRKLAPITDSMTPEFKMIEESIYTGNYQNIKTKLEEISKDSDNEKLKELISSISRKNIKSIKQATFDEKLVSSVPVHPGTSQRTDWNTFNTLERDQILEIQNFIDKIRLKIRIIELISLKDFESLKKFANLFTEEIYKNENFLDQVDCLKLFALILRNDRGMGLNFLKEFMERNQNSNPIGMTENLKIWIWMIGYPTIFDFKSYELIKLRPSLSQNINNMRFDQERYSCDFTNIESSTNIEYSTKIESSTNIESSEPESSHSNDYFFISHLQTIRNQFYDLFLNSDPSEILQSNQKIIQQIFLNLEGNPVQMENFIKFELASLGRDETEFEGIIGEILMEKEIILISSECIKILLENSLKKSMKLSKTRFLSDFFHLAFRLQTLTERTPVNSGILELTSTVAFSKLKLILSTLDGKENLSSAIYSIVSIGTDHYCTLTEDQMNYLGETLKDLCGRNREGGLNFGDILSNIDHIKSVNFKNELKELKDKNKTF